MAAVIRIAAKVEVRRSSIQRKTGLVEQGLSFRRPLLSSSVIPEYQNVMYLSHIKYII